MPALEADVQELFKKPVFATVSTLRKDGTIQSAVIWVHVTDDGHLTFNSAEGRAWPNNLLRDPRVTVAAFDPENPYRYASVTGTVVQRTTDGADAQIDALTKKYLDKDKYPFAQPGEVRESYVVEADKVTNWGA